LKQEISSPQKQGTLTEPLKLTEPHYVLCGTLGFGPLIEEHWSGLYCCIACKISNQKKRPGLDDISGRHLGFTDISVSAKTADFIGLSGCWQTLLYSSRIQTTCARQHKEPSQDSYLVAMPAGAFS